MYLDNNAGMDQHGRLAVYASLWTKQFQHDIGTSAESGDGDESLKDMNGDIGKLFATRLGRFCDFRSNYFRAKHCSGDFAPRGTKKGRGQENEEHTPEVLFKCRCCKKDGPRCEAFSVTDRRRVAREVHATELGGTTNVCPHCQTTFANLQTAEHYVLQAIMVG